MDPKNKKTFLIAGGVIVLASVALYLGMRPAPPAPSKGAIYYTGPMVNKSRTAITDEQGNIIERLDPNRPDKDGTMVNPDRNVPADSDAPASDKK